MRTETDKFGDIRTYNDKGELIHCKYTCGLEVWWDCDEESYEYDENGQLIRVRDNKG
jgi:hypothetical protein